MLDYQNGRIYTIRHKSDETLVYVGSTCEKLSRRMCKHRATSKKERNNNNLFYRTVSGDWSQFYIELYEVWPCNTKEELAKREGEVQRDIATLNTRIEGSYLTSKQHGKQYREKYVDKLKQYDKQYRVDNADKLKQQHKEYRQRKKAEKEQNQAMAIFLTEIQ